MPTHRRYRAKGRARTGAGAATLALAMSWLAFVGVRGPLDDDSRAQAVTLDYGDETEASEQREDIETFGQRIDAEGSENGEPDNRQEIALTGRGSQTPASAPPAEQGENYPDATLGRGEKLTDEAAAAPSADPAPAASPSPGKSAANKGTPEGAKADKTVTSEPVVENLPANSSLSPQSIEVRPSTMGAKTLEAEKEDGWDYLGDFFSYFRPFYLHIEPPFIEDHFAALDSFANESGQTSQPETPEDLPTAELPSDGAPTSAAPEAIAG